MTAQPAPVDSGGSPEEHPVTLAERLQAEVKTAMRNRDELRRDTLRMALSAAHNAEVAVRRPLTEEEMLGVLGKELKSRRESIEAYDAAGRDDLANRERAEAAIISEFLPAPLTPDELGALVGAAIDETGATSARDLGRVMAVLSPRTRNRADGRAVSAAVARELARRDLAAHAVGH